MKLKVLIADDERLICDMLVKFINSKELQLDIVGVSYDGDDLLKKITKLEPEIVITDISMPKIDGIEIIKRVSQMGINCKFIIISGYKQFEYAYNALKYDVVDYLLKPVQKDELNTALSKIAWQIRHDTDGISNSIGKPIKNYLVNKGIKQLLMEPKSLIDINSTFTTKFKKGYFQVILIRMDYIKKTNDIPTNATSLHNKVKNIIKQVLGQFCHELIITNDWDDIIAILNYSKENKDMIKEAFSELFTKTKNIIELFSGLTPTLCIGRIYMNVCNIEKSKNDATSAAWTRMSKGIGKIIYYKYNEEELPNQFKVKTENMKKGITKAFETLDKDMFKKYTYELFSLPADVLCRDEIKAFVRHIPEEFFDLNKDNISMFENYDRICKEVRYKIRMATTFQDCRVSLITQLSRLIDQTKSYVNSRNTKPIRQAIDYIKKNYSKPISLDDVASQVDLSAVYFSSLFKKEMNENFTNYLRDYRLNIAKNLLTNSNMSIKEIAGALSFDDARYFSKLFKKTVGIKPTEYRKIYA